MEQTRESRLPDVASFLCIGIKMIGKEEITE